jgi:hypothetical protein
MNGASHLPRIVRLQAQRSRLKVDGVYDPAPLLPSDRALLTRQGVLAAADGGWVIDVHHASHPQRPRWSAGATVSVGFTSHYERMWSRFGRRPIGVAGENIIIETDRVWTLEDLADGLVIVTQAGKVRLDGFEVAEPCIPFTRFLSDRPRADAVDLQGDLEFLRLGIRGFVTAMDDLESPFEIRVGHEVRAAE